MEAALELDDDVFFADLSKQISLLIMDDDDDDEVSLNSQYPPANLQRFANAFPTPLQTSYLSYDHQQQTCKRDQSKGTGVFIPRSSHQRRNNRQGKSTVSTNKFLRPYYDHNARGLIVPQMNYNININNPSHDQSFNNVRRRF